LPKRRNAGENGEILLPRGHGGEALAHSARSDVPGVWRFTAGAKQRLIHSFVITSSRFRIMFSIAANAACSATLSD
jgi:hypothetical protein